MVKSGFHLPITIYYSRGEKMIPAQFDYVAPSTLDEVLGLLAEHADDAKILAGGHSLIPAMKLRLAQPALLIDIGRVRSLSYIREEGGRILVGALTTHYQMESSARLREICPLLPECRSEEHTSELQSQSNLVCRLLLEKTNTAVRGVRSSWLIRDRNWVLARFARAASPLARRSASSAAFRSVMSSTNPWYPAG